MRSRKMRQATFLLPSSFPLPIALAKPGTAPRSGRRGRRVKSNYLPMGAAGEHTYFIYVHGEGILRCQSDIVAYLHHD